MINGIIGTITETWRNAMTDECFVMAIFVIVLIGTIRCGLTTVLCMFVYLWHMLEHPYKWIKNKYYISKGKRKENSKRGEKMQLFFKQLKG